MKHSKTEQGRLPHDKKNLSAHRTVPCANVPCANNLTPRPNIDLDGLSFSLVPTTTKGNAVTTLGTLRAAGFICTVEGTHVSVMPAGGMSELLDWMSTYDTADTNPHALTILLRSITA